MRQFVWTLLLFTLGITWVAGAELGVSHQTQKLVEHTLLPGTFTPRGIISFKDPRLFPLSDSAKLTKTASITKFRFSSEDTRKFKALADHDGFYSIRISSSNPHVPFLVASTRACLLVASNFRDEIILHLTTDGNIVDIDYRVPATVCTGSDLHTSTPEFSTNITILFEEEGPQPLKQAIAPEKPQQQQQDTGIWGMLKGMLWLLPVVILIANFLPRAAEGSGGRQ